MKNFKFKLDYVREQFPCLCKTVNGLPAAFLDGPGGSQVPRRVVDRISDYMFYRNANGHGCFVTSEETMALQQEGRETLAAFFNCKPNEVIFGESSSTNNFKLALALARDMKPGDEVIITDIDHESNRSPMRTLEEQGIIVKSVKIDLSTYTLDLDDYKKKLSPRTKVVAINWAANATGTITDVKTMIKMAHEVGALTIIDAVHYAPHKVIDVKDIDADFMVCSAYKFFGPHIGVMYAKAEVLDKVRTIRVLADDNTQVPEKFETGTPNYEHICGCAGAIDFIADIGSKHEEFFIEELEGLSGKRKNIVAGMLAIHAYEEPIAAKLRMGLREIEGVTLYGPPEGYDRTGTVSFTIAGKNSHDVAVFLAERGIFVWDGDFYAIEITNHVLNLGDQGGLVRVGLAPYNTIEDIDRTIQAVADFCK
ncbi:MAG: cysteine desulfurase-like protein [Peptostreptococcaceae bacterium]|nr:cysteine desulfurase-like protein [Peptostreptococcaceae bacterium]